MALLTSAALYDAIRADVVEAWDVADVFFGQPRLEQTMFAHAVIRLSSVPMEWVTMHEVEQAYNFEITYRAPWVESDDDFNIELAKEARANELIPHLMSNPTYATTGMLPLITGIEFDENDEASDPWYEVRITFQVIQHVGPDGSVRRCP